MWNGLPTKTKQASSPDILKNLFNYDLLDTFLRFFSNKVL